MDHMFMSRFDCIQRKGIIICTGAVTVLARDGGHTSVTIEPGDPDLSLVLHYKRGEFCRVT